MNPFSKILYFFKKVISYFKGVDHTALIDYIKDKIIDRGYEPSAEEFSIVLEYVNENVTLDSFKLVNPDLDFKRFRYDTAIISIESCNKVNKNKNNIRNTFLFPEIGNEFIVYLKCEVKTLYNTNILFLVKGISSNDLLPIKRRRKLDSII